MAVSSYCNSGRVNRMNYKLFTDMSAPKGITVLMTTCPSQREITVTSTPAVSRYLDAARLSLNIVVCFAFRFRCRLRQV